MRKLLLALLFCFITAPVWSQCTGVFSPHTFCGNAGGVPGIPGPVPGSGAVNGPTTSTSGDLAIFGNTTGTVLGDAGSLTGAIITSNYTFSGNITLQASNYFSGTTSLFIANITSQFYYLGTLVPAPIPSATGTNNWTGFNNFSGSTSMTGAVSMSAPTIAGQGPITIPVSATFGGTGLSSSALTSHTIPIFESTGPMSNTTAGAVGQCLNFGGPGIDPAPASGCWVLLTTMQSPTTAYSTSTAMTGYNDYMVTLENLVPFATTPFCVIQEYIVSQFIAGSYLTAGSGAASPANYIPCSNSNNVGPSPGVSGSCIIHSNANNTTFKPWECITGEAYNGSWFNNQSGGYFTFSTSMATGVQVGFTTGGVSSGIVKIYGRQ